MSVAAIVAAGGVGRRLKGRRHKSFIPLAGRPMLAWVLRALERSGEVKQVVVVANLKPATLRGVESQGMVLAASDGSSLVVVSPERSIRPGSVVK